MRQICPQARILGIPVTDDEGLTDEGALVQTLALLLLRHREAQRTGSATDLVDVLNLSLGYYPESADAAFTSQLAAVLEALGAHGVCVVAAAGNQSTVAPLMPAGLGAVEADGMPEEGIPLLSVGALNPDGTSTAWFSNAGDWVSAHRPGANLVSTLPVDSLGSTEPSARFTVGGRVRAAIDPDDYSSGFGTWSGTSFAAPVLAGEIAAHLATDATAADADPGVCVQRGRAAVRSAMPAWGAP